MNLPDNAIEARALFKTYPATRTTPAVTALKGIDLTIPRGSIFGLLGPNGAGKSTFINILAGMTKKSGGRVAIWGRDIDERPRDARGAIGVAFRRRSPPTRSSPRENPWRCRPASRKWACPASVAAWRCWPLSAWLR